MYKAIHLEPKGSRFINEQGVVVLEYGMNPTFEDFKKLMEIK